MLIQYLCHCSSCLGLSSRTVKTIQDHVRRDAKNGTACAVSNPTRSTELLSYASNNRIRLDEQRYPAPPPTTSTIPQTTSAESSGVPAFPELSVDVFYSPTAPESRSSSPHPPLPEEVEPLETGTISLEEAQDVDDYGMDICLSDEHAEIASLGGSDDIRSDIPEDLEPQDVTVEDNESITPLENDDTDSPPPLLDVDDSASIGSATDIFEDTTPFFRPPAILPDHRHTILEEDPDPLEALNDETNDVPETNDSVLPSLSQLSLDMLRAEMIGSYRCPSTGGNPSLHPSGPRPLTLSEEATLRHYLAWKRSSGTTQAYREHARSLSMTSKVEIMGLSAARKLVKQLTGIVPKKVDICPNNCLAYVGPHTSDTSCPAILRRDIPANQHTGGNMARKKGEVCGHPRFLPKNGPGKQRNPRRYAQMIVIPIFEVIRAMFANSKTAKLLRHRDHVMMEALKALHEASLRTYSDFGDGQIQMTLRAKGLFVDPRECAGAITTDGAMLTMQRQSEVWVAILLLYNLPPEVRYLLQHLIVMFVIPGPWAPGHIESFFYQSFVDMLQASEGIWMYDAYASERFIFKFHLVGLLGDLMASYKFNAGTGTSGVHADIYTNVAGAKTTAKGKRQYIVVWRDHLIRKLNPDRPHYDYNTIPLRDEAYFLDALRKLAGARNATERQRIALETGVTRLPLFSTSTGWTYPTFFPLDCLHQLYANNANNLYRFNLEIGVISTEQHQEIGRMLVRAMRTLPGSFSSPVRNIAEKLNTSYKLFEWMALVHWYIGPFLIELGVDHRYINHFSKFSRIAEVSMRPHAFTDLELDELTHLIISYLIEYEILYINSTEDASRARIVTFQLLQIPRIIRAWGSYRSVSQGTCERMIGWLGHKVTSRKSPYAHLTNLVLEHEIAKCLELYYPSLFPPLAPRNPVSPQSPLRKAFPFQQPDLAPFSDFSIHLPHLAALTGLTFDVSLLKKLNAQLKRWGRYCLPTGVILRSQINELRMARLSRSSRYFEGTFQGQSIFGEVVAFYQLPHSAITYVAYYAIKDVVLLWGVWLRGSISPVVTLQPVEVITSLIGIWQYGDNVYILRKHAAQAVLSAPDGPST